MMYPKNINDNKEGKLKKYHTSYCNSSQNKTNKSEKNKAPKKY